MPVDIAAFPEEDGVLDFDAEDPEAELPDALLGAVVAGVVPVVAPLVVGAAVLGTAEVTGVVAVPFKQLVGPPD